MSSPARTNANQISKEQIILIASGLLAVVLVAWISFANSGSIASLVVHVLFAIFFLTSAFRSPLGLPASYGPLSLVLMLVLVLISLFIFSDTVILILAVVLAASAPYHLAARACWLLLLFANGLYWFELHVLHDMQGYLAAWATLIALQIFALSSSLARTREEASQQLLARQNDELLASRAIMAQRSRAEERFRIAGDLHDTLGHRLTALQLQLEAIAHQAPESLKREVLQTKATAADLLEEVRQIVKEIPGTPRDDLATAIRELAELTPRVVVEISGELPAVTPELGQQLVFCTQEAISNAVRHGGADLIRICYEQGAIQISDNGSGLGSRPAREGFGLSNIRKRLAPFAGHASLDQRRNERGCVLSLFPGEGALS